MTRTASRPGNARRVALRDRDRSDLIDAMIAKTITELAKAGERNPNILSEAALQAL